MSEKRGITYISPIVLPLWIVGDLTTMLQTSVKIEFQMFSKMKASKSSLIRMVGFTNLLLLIIGIFLVYAAVKITKISENYEVIRRPFNYELSAPLTAAGLAFLLVAGLGLVGIVKEHPTVIEYHIWSLLILLVLELLIAVTTFPFPQIIPARTMNAMNLTMEKYTTCWFERMKFDFLQNDYMCCGIHGPQDWKRFHIHEAIVTIQKETFSVPRSCCMDKKCEKIYLHGCFRIIEFLVKRSYTDFLYAVGCMAVLQLLEMVLATWLILALKEIEDIHMRLKAIKIWKTFSETRNPPEFLTESKVVP